MSATNTLNQRRLCTLLGAIAVAICAAETLPAAMITNTSTSTVLFRETFENQTVGAVPTTANMTPGAAGSSWVPTTGSNATNATNLHTNNQASDGVTPFQGSKYMEIDRNNANTSRARISASFTPLSSGQSMRFETAYYYISGYAQFSFNTSSSTSAINLFNLLGASADGDHGDKWFVGAPGTLDGQEPQFDISIGTANQWHILTLDYTMGTKNVTISVDGGAPGTIVNENIDTALLLGAVQINANGSGNSHFYVDAVPEPAAIVLCAAAIVSLSASGIRRRARNND